MTHTDQMHWWWLRAALNTLNGSSLLGLGIAALGRARVARGPGGLVLATGYGLDFPRASAFTVGNVIISGHDAEWLDQRPQLLAHEERHTWQYAACVGLPMIPLYLLAAGYSLLRGGDPTTHNGFEQLAGLADGGYPLVSRRVREQRARTLQAG